MAATSRLTTFNATKRSSSLPQLLSTAHIIEKAEIKNKLSKLTLRIKDLKNRGLRQMLIDRED
jgi:hypothetical protein